MRVWRRLALIVPPWPSAGVAATRFGLSSQLALAEFANTLAWTVPNSFTGKRVVDSTFVCASSATWVCSISTAGGAGASAGTCRRQRVDLRAQLAHFGAKRRKLAREVGHRVLREGRGAAAVNDAVASAAERAGETSETHHLRSLLPSVSSGHCGS